MLTGYKEHGEEERGMSLPPHSPLTPQPFKFVLKLKINIDKNLIDYRSLFKSLAIENRKTKSNFIQNISDLFSIELFLVQYFFINDIHLPYPA